MQRSNRQEVIDKYQKMTRAFIAGDLGRPVEAEYPLEDILAALIHAASDRRQGKILPDPTLDRSLACLIIKLLDSGV